MGILRRNLKRNGPRWEGWHLFCHRVSVRTSDGSGFEPLESLTISPDVLDRVLSEFCSMAEPLSLDHVVDSIGARKALPSSFFVVSFDDGYLDNSETALPILVKHRVPATLFATTGFIEGTVPPVERALADYLLHTDHVTLQISDSKREWHTETTQTKDACYQELRGMTRPLPHGDRCRIIESLRPRCQMVSDREYGFMDRDQLREWEGSQGLSVGCHSHSHPVLTGLSRRECSQDIHKSLSLLEEWLDEPIRHFSYPYGEWSPAVAHIVRGADFRSGSTTRPDRLLRGADVMALPRLEVRSSWVDTADGLSNVMNR